MTQGWGLIELIRWNNTLRVGNMNLPHDVTAFYHFLAGWAFWTTPSTHNGCPLLRLIGVMSMKPDPSSRSQIQVEPLRNLQFTHATFWTWCSSSAPITTTCTARNVSILNEYRPSASQPCPGGREILTAAIPPLSAAATFTWLRQCYRGQLQFVWSVDCSRRRTSNCTLRMPSFIHEDVGKWMISQRQNGSLSWS